MHKLCQRELFIGACEGNVKGLEVLNKYIGTSEAAARDLLRSFLGKFRSTSFV